MPGMENGRDEVDNAILWERIAHFGRRATHPLWTNRQVGPGRGHASGFQGTLQLPGAGRQGYMGQPCSGEWPLVRSQLGEVAGPGRQKALMPADCNLAST